MHIWLTGWLTIWLAHCRWWHCDADNIKLQCVPKNLPVSWIKDWSLIWNFNVMWWSYSEYLILLTLLPYTNPDTYCLNLTACFFQLVVIYETEERRVLWTICISVKYRLNFQVLHELHCVLLFCILQFQGVAFIYLLSCCRKCFS